MRPLYVSLAVVASFVSTIAPACRKAAPEGPLPGVSTVKIDDRCTHIPHGCAGTEEDDGCPDVVLPAGAGCAFDERSEKLLNEMTQEILNEPDLTDLRIVASSVPCADAVRDRLQALGVPEGRLSTRVSANHSVVSFEAAAWKGVVCR